MTKKQEKYHQNDKNKKSIIGMAKTKNVIPNSFPYCHPERE